MDWIKDNKGAGAWAFTKQPNKWAYLNCKRWSDIPEAVTFSQAKGYKIDPELHDPCGHWHLPEELPPPPPPECPGITYTVFSAPVVPSLNDAFAAYDGWDQGYVCKYPLNALYSTAGRYVLADYGFKTKTKYPAETNGCRLIVPDPNEGFIYFFSAVSGMGTKRFWKLNYTNMSWVMDTFLTANWNFYEGFIYDDYIIVSLSMVFGSPSILKIKKSDLSIDSSITLPCAYPGNVTYLYEGGNIAFFTVDGNTSLVDLDAFVVLSDFTNSGNGENSVNHIGLGIVIAGTGTGHPFYVVDAICGLICWAGAGSPSEKLGLDSDNMIWGWDAYLRTLSAKSVDCCNEYGYCTQDKLIVLPYVGIPWITPPDNQYSIYCKAYDYIKKAGVYGAGYGWIETATFDLHNSVFTAHQICEPIEGESSRVSEEIPEPQIWTMDRTF